MVQQLPIMNSLSGSSNNTAKLSAVSASISIVASPVLTAPLAIGRLHLTG